MFQPLIKWDIYEVVTKTTLVNGVMFRGRIRKLCLNHNRNVLVENTEDIQASVRFAVPAGESPVEIKKYILNIAPDADVSQVAISVPNPVLSKLKVNLEDRYNL